MTITTNLVEAFLKCPTKCFLQARAEVETGNAYANWVRTETDVFRSEGVKRLVAGVAPDKFVTCAPATERGKSAQWQWGVDFVAQSENLQCCCHALERIPSTGPGRAAQFVPVRFVFSNKLTRLDKLLLAFDALVISRALGRDVSIARIVYGDDPRHSEGKGLVPEKRVGEADR